MSATDNSATQPSAEQPGAKTIKIPSKVKNLSFVLATLGVVPIFICSLGIATHVNQSPLLLKILLAYSAMFVSFLCGLHWGIAICQDVKFPKLSRTLLVEGFIVGLGALAVYLFINIVWIQICVFSGMLVLIWLIDLIISIKKLIPLWVIGLRTLITILVVGLLAVAYFQEIPQHQQQLKKQISLQPVVSHIATIPNK